MHDVIIVMTLTLMSGHRGRFTLIRNVKPLGGGKTRHVAKIIPYDHRRKADSLREYEMLKDISKFSMFVTVTQCRTTPISLANYICDAEMDRIVRLFEAYHHNDYVVLVLEKLYGENVVRSLSLKNKYNEQHVVSIVKQVISIVKTTDYVDHVMLLFRCSTDCSICTIAALSSSTCSQTT